MKWHSILFIAVCWMFFVFTAPATVFYVDVNSTNPVPPYAGWSTASTNIQKAIDAATNGDFVLVTNGLYVTGGKSMDNTITNRVSINKAITVQSVNGPSVTIIQGAWDPTSTNGLGAVRCAWLTNNAVLNGFTLRGGATGGSTFAQLAQTGGGVFGTTNRFNVLPSAIVTNCIITLNVAKFNGGGAYLVQLNNCTIAGNIGFYQGGGASACSLKNCTVTGNYATYGGGTDHSLLNNCAVIGNSASQMAGGAYYGSLINCTVSKNWLTGVGNNYGAGAAYAVLTNCIVYLNNGVDSYGVNSNYMGCTFAFCCSFPLPSGTGNIGTDPQLLADGVHLAAMSPCIGAGLTSVVSGTDIDGQAWNNPPSIGCDEWQPAPVVSAPLIYQINSPAHGLTFNVIAGGQLPFTFFWSKDGAAIQDDGHHSNSGSANLIVNNVGPDDAGLYQVVVSNSFGVVTGQLAQVVIHAVDAAGANPGAPYATWTTAATNIQDAIGIASAGDIVLVTNGLYATGGKVMAGDLTNRVALDRAVTVMSVNGYAVTAILGAWDSTSTNGPGAVRCAWLTNGAVLIGFTLQNGATRATGDIYTGGPLESGGGVWCNSTNSIVSNCVLSNNSAVYGGGIKSGTLNNSLVLFNQATHGGGTYNTTLNNCTVFYNHTTITTSSGGGTYGGLVNNSIVVFNYNNYYFSEDDYYMPAGFYNSCALAGSFLTIGKGNISVNPQFVDLYRIGSASPCVGTGSALYATGTDLDGQTWLNPPSMGCAEMIVSNLVGPLSVNAHAYQTNFLVNRYASFWGTLTGRAAGTIWTFGDGQTATNTGNNNVSHRWTNPGDFAVTYTAYNNDNPAGVSTNITVHVQPLDVPQLQSAVMLTNGFQFQFAGQLSANYIVQYSTNLTPPVAWQTLQNIYFSTGGVHQIIDPATTDATRFYRVGVQ